MFIPEKAHKQTIPPYQQNVLHIYYFIQVKETGRCATYITHVVKE